MRSARTYPAEVRLERAVERYRSQFGADAMPCLFCVRDLQGEAVAVAVAMLEHAVATGRPLRYGQVATALGEGEPPMGGGL